MRPSSIRKNSTDKQILVQRPSVVVINDTLWVAAAGNVAEGDVLFLIGAVAVEK